LQLEFEQLPNASHATSCRKNPKRKLQTSGLFILIRSRREWANRRRCRSIIFPCLPALAFFFGPLFFLVFPTPLFKGVLIFRHACPLLLKGMNDRSARTPAGTCAQRMLFRVICWRRLVGAASAAPTPATAAIAAASATTTAASAAAAATTTATLFARARFVYGQGSAVVLFEVETLNGRLCLGIAAHLDEAETFAATRVTVHDDLRTLHLSERRK
jgi:hypothetical protein